MLLDCNLEDDQRISSSEGLHIWSYASSPIATPAPHIGPVPKVLTTALLEMVKLAASTGLKAALCVVRSVLE